MNFFKKIKSFFKNLSVKLSDENISKTFNVENNNIETSIADAAFGNNRLFPTWFLTFYRACGRSARQYIELMLYENNIDAMNDVEREHFLTYIGRRASTIGSVNYNNFENMVNIRSPLSMRDYMSGTIVTDATYGVFTPRYTTENYNHFGDLSGYSKDKACFKKVEVIKKFKQEEMEI